MNKLFHIFFLSLGGLSSAIADLKRPKAPLRCWQLANPALFGSADAFRNHRGMSSVRILHMRHHELGGKDSRTQRHPRNPDRVSVLSALPHPLV